MKASPPLVSVVMPIFDRAHTVLRAVRSILTQTLEDLELIVVDDGSEDDGARLVEELADSRLRIYRLPVNCGVATARNLGMRLARGRFIAVMDSDDEARPERLERQVDFLEREPDVQVLGTRASKRQGTVVIDMEHPCRDGVIKALLARIDGASMIHPTSMMRRRFLVGEGISYPATRVDEDYGLWLRIMQSGGDFATLPETLLDYHRHDTNVTVRHDALDLRWKARLRREILAAQLPDLRGVEIDALARLLDEGASLDLDERCLACDALHVADRHPTAFGTDRGTLFAMLTDALARHEATARDLALTAAEPPSP